MLRAHLGLCLPVAFASMHLGAGPVRAQAEAPAKPAAFSARIERADVRAVADVVARWQFAHLDDFSCVTKFQQETGDTRGWVQGALYVGALQWARASGAQSLTRQVRSWAEGNQYRLGDRLYHADDHTAGRTYLELHRQGVVDQRALTSVKAYFDAILAAPSTLSLKFDQPELHVSTQDRWSWSDALFMSPPAWFALSGITKDPRYAAFADREFWATTDYLFDEAGGLYYRDSRFKTRRGPDGEKLFWSRGNGWVVGGLVAVLETLPKSDPRRARYEGLFRKLATSLKRSQQASGFWSSSLLATDGAPESSGTGFFVYGLQRGIDMGLLPAREYRPSVERGWRALVRAVQPDGRLGYVQQIGDAPEAVRLEDTQLYGSGALMLAASALYTAAPR